MGRPSILVIAGEPSGDALAAELILALRRQTEALGSGLECFGAGGPRLAGAGVELAFDMTAHAVVGLVEVIKHYGEFRRLFNRLLELAFTRRPDLILCVDFSGFNRRFASAVRRRAREQAPEWKPRIVQYVSPQVWASRPGRARKMARDFDLLLSIFPFEKDWYATRVPNLRVEFVGHPLLQRHGQFPPLSSPLECPERAPGVLLLPGSRVSELKRHLPVLLPALGQLRVARPDLRARMVLSDQHQVPLVRTFSPPADLEVQVGGLAEAMAGSALALASTGTVTMECAYFGLPTVTLYKTSWLTYQIARQLVQVHSLTMPNLLAGTNVFPEFIQDAATPDNLARAALELLEQPARRREIRGHLARIITSLGSPDASQRAATLLLPLLQPSSESATS